MTAHTADNSFSREIYALANCTSKIPGVSSVLLWTLSTVGEQDVPYMSTMPVDKSFTWWGLSVVCEQTLKAAAHPPPVRVPDGSDCMRILSLLPDKLKALFYGQQRPLPARATSSSFPGPESACSVDCLQRVGALAGGNFI